MRRESILLSTCCVSLQCIRDQNRDCKVEAARQLGNQQLEGVTTELFEEQQVLHMKIEEGTKALAEKSVEMERVHAEELRPANEKATIHACNDHFARLRSDSTLNHVG